MTPMRCPPLSKRVDTKRDSVILPIFGLPTPFHVSSIKNTSYNDQDEEQVVLRINFAAPGGAFSKQGDFAKVWISRIYIYICVCVCVFECSI